MICGRFVKSIPTSAFDAPSLLIAPDSSWQINSHCLTIACDPELPHLILSYHGRACLEMDRFSVIIIESR